MALKILVDEGHSKIRALLAGTGAGFGGRFRGIDQAWKNLKLEFDEEPMACAARELKEEIGYKARKITFLTQIHPAIGFTIEVDAERGEAM